MVYRGGLENRWVNSPGGSNPSLSDHWSGAREAEGAGLLNRCTVMVPGVRIPPAPEIELQYTARSRVECLPESSR